MTTHPAPTARTEPLAIRAARRGDIAAVADLPIARQVAAPVMAFGLLLPVALLGIGWGFVLRAVKPDGYARIGLGRRAAMAGSGAAVGQATVRGERR